MCVLLSPNRDYFRDYNEDEATEEFRRGMSNVYTVDSLDTKLRKPSDSWLATPFGSIGVLKEQQAEYTYIYSTKLIYYVCVVAFQLHPHSPVNKIQREEKKHER